MDSDLVFRVALGLLLLSFFLHRGYYTKKHAGLDDRTLAKRSPGLPEHVAGILSLVALLATAAYLFAPRLVGWAAVPFPLWLRWSAILTSLLALGLLQWSQVTLGRNWSDTPRLMRDQRIVTEGPYRWVRHPIYTAFLLFIGSFVLITANWLVGGAWLATTAIDITARVRYEERLLADQFGDQYLNYAKKTGRLIPRLPFAPE